MAALIQTKSIFVWILVVCAVTSFVSFATLEKTAGAWTSKARFDEEDSITPNNDAPRDKHAHEVGTTSRAMTSIVADDTSLLRLPRRTSPNFIVLLTCSTGFHDMWTNWIRHFEKLQISDLPVHLFAEDEDTYLKCMEDFGSSNGQAVANVTCLSFESIFPQEMRVGSIKASGYRSTQYKKMMSQRPSVVLKELQQGHDVIFADVDTVWLKNPLPYFEPDFAVSSDDPSEIHVWGQKDARKRYKKYGKVDYLCAGNMVMKSCPETIALVERWRSDLEGEEERNQPKFNELLTEAKMDGIEVVADGRTEKRKMVSKTLPTNLFPSGSIFFDEMTEEERKAVVVVHNNFAIGYEKKVQRFKKYGLWLVGDGLDK